MSENKHTTAVFLGPLVHLLHERGQDAAAVLGRHGLELAVTRDPEARVDAALSTALLDDCQALLNEPGLGIELARHSEYTAFGALGLALAAGGDLYGVLNRITRFHRLISDLVRTELHADEHTVALHFHATTDHQPHPQAIAFAMASIVRMLRIRIRRDYDPVAVMLPAQIDAGLERGLQRYFRCAVEHGDCFGLVFDQGAARQMLACSDAQLAAMLDATLAQRLAEVEGGSLASKLSLWIEERLPEGEPALAEAASAFCLSSRSLQRRLSDEGLSWKQLLESTRKSLVQRHLRSPGMSITQLAFLLGFTEVSSFSRAFKKWYGVSPSQFRQ